MQREHLEAIVEELRRLRDGGLRTVPVSEATMESVRTAVRRRRSATTPASTASATEAHSPVAAVQPTRAAARPGPAPTSAPASAAPLGTPARLSAPPAATGLVLEPPAPTAAAKAAPADPAIAPIPAPTPFVLPPGDKASRWQWLRDRVLNDAVCRAHVRPGKQVVFGVGSVEARIFFCGEAPGAEEEEQGEPFVGKAGQLLTKIIEAMALKRPDVYIGNIMNWRPEMPNMDVGNRPPTAAEIAYCLPFLRAQVEIVQPQVIVALGNTAITGLLGPDPDRKMGQIRGKWLDFHGTPLMPTYHPSYLLRNQSLDVKRIVWEDMLLVMERVGLEITPKQRAFFLPKPGVV